MTQTGTAQLEIQASGTYGNAISISGAHGVANFDPGTGGGAISLNVDGGSFTLSGPITIAGGTSTEISTYSSNSTVTLSGGIGDGGSGTGNLILAGGGAATNHSQTFILSSANNNYGGTTTLLGSAANLTLQLSATNALPTATTLTLQGDYYSNTALMGWLDLHGNSQQLAGLLAVTTSLHGGSNSGDNRVVNSGAGTPTLALAPTGTDLFSGVLGGGTPTSPSNNSFNLAMSGLGTLALTGANTYSGTTTINSGILRVGNGGASGSLGSTSSISDGGTLVFDLTGALTVSAPLSGSGGLQQIGSGTTILSGTNTFSGSTTVSAGELEFNAFTTTMPSSSITVNAGAAVAAGPAYISGSGSSTPLGSDFLPLITPASTGTVALTADSSENLDFSSSGFNFTGLSLGAIGTATYSGTLTPNGTTYRLGGGGGTLIYANSLPDAAAGSTALNVVSPGTVVLASNNTYTGPTTIAAGATLQIGNAGSTGSLGTNYVLNNGTLAFNFSSTTQTVGNPISGTGSVTQAGSGILTLTAANSYSGPTVISSGTLRLAPVGAAPTIQNASFASPSTGNYIYYGQMTGPSTTAGTQQANFVWTAGGNGYTGVGSGTTGPAVFTNGSDWGYSTVPVGTQGLTLQRDSFVTQSLNFTSAGVYTLSWESEARVHQGSGPTGQTIDVELNGTTIYTYDDTSTSSWQTYSTPFYILSPGNYSITFAGTVTSSDVSEGLNNVNLSGGAVGSSSLPASSPVQIASGATLDLYGINQTIPSLANSGTGGGTVTNSTSTPATLTITPAAGTSTTFGGSISDGSAQTTLTINGPGTQVLGGQNMYTGPTNILQGTLVLGTSGSSVGSLVPTSSVVLGSASQSTGGIFQLGDAGNSVSQTIASLTNSGTAASAVVGGNAVNSTLTINTSSVDTYNGNFGGSGTNQNNLAVALTGGGTLRFGGVATNSGPTIISNGTLRTTANGAVGAAVQNASFESPAHWS